MGFANSMMRATAKHSNTKSVGNRRAKVEARKNLYESEIKASSETWKPLMETFDANKSGTLEPEQLKQILAIWNKGTQPSERQLAFIMSVADKSGTGAVEIEELGTAAGTWMALQADQVFIDEHMDKFDTDKSGALNKDQLKAMMKTLNDDIEPEDDQVECIFKIADTSKTGEINRWEVRKAVEEWYGYAALANDQRKTKEENAKKKEGGGGGCCTIS
jgi:Ca2+-binding EF-hand superfamily protein